MGDEVSKEIINKIGMDIDIQGEVTLVLSTPIYI